MEFLNNNTHVSITIATDVLSVGWDSQHTRNAVVFGEPADVDEFVQKIGRIGRNRRLVQNPRAFLYYSRSALQTAQRVIDNHTSSNCIDPLPSRSANAPNSATETMDISMARLLLAECRPRELDLLYNNPVEDEECTCHPCRNNPPAKRPEKCACNGPKCQPETLPTDFQFVMFEGDNSTSTQKTRTRRGEAITKDMRTFGTQALQEFRQEVFMQADEEAYGFLPPQPFLPDDIIQALIDKIYSIHTIDDIALLVSPDSPLKPHMPALLERCIQLRSEFDKQRDNMKAKRSKPTSELTHDEQSSELTHSNIRVKLEEAQN
ncbi:hypothetical protein CVT26_007945 [Gymnopilus dilepis]|uniref:Helicase C-terminal domain-containing protein n=1 Tax=Gymnopilus dilepis TaxID=231916 RepID=A0A409WEH3_9AGAR|nr:hypothetical protein CVT26_007945 [Gymnopilus dilepis]